MFNRQFGLLVMATLLLSPNLVHANEFNEDTHLSIGNIQIHTTGNGTTLRTPKIQIDTPKPSENRVLISRRRIRTTAVRTKRPPSAAIMRQQIDSKVKTTINKTTSSTSNPIIHNSTIQNQNSTIQNSVIRNSNQNTTVRSSTIQNSTNGVRSVNEHHQSVHCSGGGSSVSQSISTVNGRTVSSEVRGNCNSSGGGGGNDD